MMTVHFTEEEWLLATLAAGQRRLNNLNKGTSHRYGLDRDDAEALDMIGCRGEMAVAKALNLFWSGGVVGDVDVGGVVEVRATTRKGNRLILHPGDRDEVPFVLAIVGNGREVILPGWIKGRDGKRPAWWSEPVPGRAAYFVPQGSLRPMADLVAMLKREQTA